MTTTPAESPPPVMLGEPAYPGAGTSIGNVDGGTINTLFGIALPSTSTVTPTPPPNPVPNPFWTKPPFWLTVVSYVLPVIALIWHKDLSAAAQAIAYAIAGLTTVGFIAYEVFERRNVVITWGQYNDQRREAYRMLDISRVEGSDLTMRAERWEHEKARTTVLPTAEELLHEIQGLKDASRNVTVRAPQPVTDGGTSPGLVTGVRHQAARRRPAKAARKLPAAGGRRPAKAAKAPARKANRRTPGPYYDPANDFAVVKDVRTKRGREVKEMYRTRGVEPGESLENVKAQFNDIPIRPAGSRRRQRSEG